MAKYELDQVTIRMVKERTLLSDVPFSAPDSAVRVMNELLKDYDREVFAVVNLQIDNRPINMNIVSIGTIDRCIVSPRELLKSIVLSNAASVMLVHNHPSGNLTPSKEDNAVTRQIMELLNLMDVRLLDHIILGNNDRYYSYMEHGTLPVGYERNWNIGEPIDLKKQKLHRERER